VLDRALVAGEVRMHDLDGDRLLEASVTLRAREVDIGHAARAEPLDDLPPPDHRARREV
jgi:hypothetical protein